MAALTVLRCSAVWLCLWLATAAPAFGGDSYGTTFGTNPALTDGVDALKARDYQAGVTLTLAGLAAAVDRRERAAALSNLCAGYAGLGDHVAALSACNESLALNSRNWRAYNNRALAHLGLGRLAQARTDLDAGLAINPEASSLADVQALLASREAALHLTMAALETGPP